jgi:glycosyltransferase involved in cell wall biosynthesis
MRVAIVISSLGSGGAERVAVHLANAWVVRGWDVTLITLTPKTADFYPINPEVKWRPLDLVGESANLLQGLAANLRRVQALRRVLRELKPDTVLGIMTQSAVHTLLAARFTDCRVVVAERIHPSMVSVGWLWGLLRRFTYPWAFRVVMLSTEGLHWLETHIPRAKGVVIPNPVLFPLPSSAPVLPVEHFILPERRLLLAVGRLDMQKGFADLLESFGALAPRYLSWDLVILGEGPERPRLVQQVAELGLQQRVFLPGRSGNIGDWYDRADLYVMSSRFEGFPNTLAEAMAYGCAAVSYDCDTGPRDIIRHGQDGLLVTPVGDIPALARALDRLMGDDAERERMATRAIEVRERYSPEKILRMWDSLFQEKTAML